MAQRTLEHVSEAFRRTLGDCRSFAADASRWALPGGPLRISRRRRDSIVELVFLRAFLAWETFLEDSFVLYLVGRTAPRGRAPYRYTLPPTMKLAEEWLVPEGRTYANWDATSVSDRSERYFRDSRPFAAALRSHQNLLSDAKTIRNAIAHESKSAYTKFENVARVKLGTLPSNLTVGSFLNTTVAGSTPPQSYLEFYLEKMEFVSSRIIPGT